MRYSFLIWITFISVWSPWASAEIGEQAIELDKQIITGESSKRSLELLSITEKLGQVPGGTNFIAMDQIQGSSNLADILNFEAGIVVQEFFGGNDQPRINIRGSGIQDNPVNRGIQLLYDGVAINQADGSFIVGLLDPDQAKYVSVYRGANAMRYGATTLGGAINFHSRTAHNSDPSIKLLTGSAGLKKLSLTQSNKENNILPVNYALRFSHEEQHGFRNNSKAERHGLVSQFNSRFERWDNSTLIHITENEFEIPFLLTKDESIKNPDSVMGEGNSPMDELLNINIRQPYRHSKQNRISNISKNKHQYGSNRVSFAYEQVDDKFRNPLIETHTQSQNAIVDISSEFTFTQNNYLQTDFLIFLSYNEGSMPRDYRTLNPVTGKPMEVFADVDLKASNQVVGFQIQQDLDLDWSAVLALQWVNNERKIIDQYSDEILDSEFRYQIANPKAGLIYEFNPDNRIYANYSGSSEAPNFWQLSVVESHPHDPLNSYLFINDLTIQTAKTAEIGFHFSQSVVSGQASYYYSTVKKELISVVGDFAVNGKTVNYEGNTLHQGIELALNIENKLNKGSHTKLKSKIIYNYSDFRFLNGIYGGNHIAGIPTHLIQGELNLEMKRNTYVSASMQWQPIKSWTDHMNTKDVRQDEYLLLNTRLGYEWPMNVRTFLEINNLTDETYQTAYAIRGQGSTTLPTFIPGSGRHFAAGINFKW